jgi:hypothetical protein
MIFGFGEYVDFGKYSLDQLVSLASKRKKWKKGVFGKCKYLQKLGNTVGYSNSQNSRTSSHCLVETQTPLQFFVSKQTIFEDMIIDNSQHRTAKLW